jgi:hypothetical protein
MKKTNQAPIVTINTSPEKLPCTICGVADTVCKEHGLYYCHDHAETRLFSKHTTALPERKAA